MILPQDVAVLRDSVQQATTAYVLLGMNPTYDAVASALAIYLSLKAAGKEVQIASADEMRVEFSHLVGVDEVKTKIGNRNLVVSFDYEENSVEKVSYNISEDGKKFNLVISPKAGGRPLNPQSIEYSYNGAEAELVFLVGAGAFEELAEIYHDNKTLFENAMTVSVNAYLVPPFAKVNVDSSGQSSMAEGVVTLLTELGLDPRDDIATNLLSSIEQATQRFQSLGVSAESFETAAHLMRNGARRSASNPALHPNVPTNTPSFAQVLRDRSQVGVRQQQVARQALPVQAQIQEQQLEPVAQPLKATAQRIRQLKRSISSQIPQLQSEQPIAQPQDAPSEWTQPKVFTGSTRV